MKPRELITTSIESTLLEPLGNIGFTFSKSSLTFKRKINGFVQSIHFQLNRYNEENVCAEFWSSYRVSSKAYLKWYKAEFGQDILNDSLGAEMDWNIENWKFPIIDNEQESHFQIVEEAQREKVLSILKDNIFKLGIPYLDYITNWENAAYRLILKDWFHYRACDFFLIAGNREKALWALEQGLDCWKRKPKASFPEHRDEIYIRLAKYFGKL